MAKRVDNDATMEVTDSQLLKVGEAQKRPIPPRAASGGKPAAKNDASMWAYRVVGTDDFAPTPTTETTPRARTWLVVALVLAIVGAGGYFAYAHLIADDPAPPAPVAKPPDPPPPPPPPPKPPAKAVTKPALTPDAAPAAAPDAAAAATDTPDAAPETPAPPPPKPIAKPPVKAITKPPIKKPAVKAPAKAPAKAPVKKPAIKR